MKYVIIDPVITAGELAKQKIIDDLVNENGKSAVLKESDLYKADGEFKTWVQGIYMDEYKYFFKIFTNNHNEKLLKNVR